MCDSRKFPRITLFYYFRNFDFSVFPEYQEEYLAKVALLMGDTCAKESLIPYFKLFLFVGNIVFYAAMGVESGSVLGSGAMFASEIASIMARGLVQAPCLPLKLHLSWRGLGSGAMFALEIASI